MHTSQGGAKTVVIVVVAVLAVIVVAGLGLLGWAKSSGEEMQRTFFTAVLSGEPNQVMAIFHPALREEVDAPVLAVWMAAVKDKLGAFQGLSRTDFSTSTEIKNGVKITCTSGTVNFEKGSAQSELKYVDGRMTAFNVVSASIPKDWFGNLAIGPTPLYRDRGKAFLTLFLTDKPEDAFGMMHESLQEQAPLEKLKIMMAAVSKDLGPLKSVECQSEQAAGPGKLKIFYRVQGGKDATTASVKFERDGLKYHLIGFKLRDEAELAEQPATLPAEPPAERP